MNSKNSSALGDLESRLRMLLPEEYQDCYTEIRPVSMGSADLKYDADGRVAWGEMWGSFCDLAMAGGPPHRGILLEPATEQEINTHRGRYEQVALEICRGISMVTGLEAEQSHLPGWVRVYCRTDAMAGWLARAVIMENVSAQLDGPILSVPAGPSYRIEKEIKNVITALAKTCHYWLGHMSSSRQQAIANLFIRMELESPLVQPALIGPYLPFAYRQTIEGNFAKATDHVIQFGEVDYKYVGWAGLEYAKVDAAIRMMRLLLAGNVLSRREGTMIFVPLNPETDPAAEKVLQAVESAHRFLTTRDLV